MADNYYNPNMPYYSYTPETEEPAKAPEYGAWNAGNPNETDVNTQAQPYYAPYGQDNGFNPYAASNYPQESYYPTQYPYTPAPDYSQSTPQPSAFPYAPQTDYYGGYAPAQPTAPIMPSPTEPYAQPYVAPSDYTSYSPLPEAEPTAPTYENGGYRPMQTAPVDYAQYNGYQPTEQTAPVDYAQYNGYQPTSQTPSADYAPYNYQPAVQPPQANSYAGNASAPVFQPITGQPTAQATVAQTYAPNSATVQSEPYAPYVPRFEENSFTRKYAMPVYDDYNSATAPPPQQSVHTEEATPQRAPEPVEHQPLEASANIEKSVEEYAPAAFEEPSSVSAPAPAAFEEPSSVSAPASAAFEEPTVTETLLPDAFVPFEAPAAASQPEDIFSSLVTPEIYSEPEATVEDKTVSNNTAPPIFNDFDTSYGEQPTAFEHLINEEFANDTAVEAVLNTELPESITEPDSLAQEAALNDANDSTEPSVVNEPPASNVPNGFPQFASFGAVATDTALLDNVSDVPNDFTQQAQETEPQNDFEFEAEPESAQENVPQFEFSDDFETAPIAESDNNAESLSGAIERIAAQHETPQNTEEIFKIAEEMSRSVLANSYNRVFNENNLAPSKKVFCLKASGLSADYYLLKSGGQPYLMYDNVDITVHASSCTALISDVKLASYALSKAIGELADYRSDEVELSETEGGYDHDVLYIGNDSMLPTEFTVMEYLLFALGNIDLAGDNEDYDNEDMLQILLSQMGISDWADVGTKELTHNKRILLLALSAALNPFVSCIIINDPQFKVTHADDMLARRIFAKLMSEGKGVLLSSCSEHLMATVANRVIAIRSGRVVFDGSYKQFLDKFCLGIMSFTSSKPDETVEFFVQHYPNVSALTNGNLVYLLKKHEGDIDLDSLLKDALRNGADHRSIVLDEKSFEIASKEVLRGI